MAALFAVDSFGGGFVVNAYIAYYLARRFDASPELIGVLFFAIGVPQAASFQAAVRQQRATGSEVNEGRAVGGRLPGAPACEQIEF